MSGGENCIRRPLFGGAISSTFPVRFQDVSNIRDVPDHQEVFVDPARDESLIFELLDLKGEVDDGGSALWFLRDIANEQDAGDNMVVEHSGTLELAGLRIGEAPAVAGTAIGQLAVSKGRQGREAQNIVRLYLANIRLKNAATDVVITGYEALLINTPDPSMPAWLDGLPRAPEYRPTESEFANPITFLSRVEREAAAYGIGKVIPPYPRPSRRFVFAHLNHSLITSSDGAQSHNHRLLQPYLLATSLRCRVHDPAPGARHYLKFRLQSLQIIWNGTCIIQSTNSSTLTFQVDQIHSYSFFLC